MADTMQELSYVDTSDFQAEAEKLAASCGLQCESFEDDGMVASLGDALLVQFSYDRDAIIVSLGSRAKPHAFFPLEYVAVMQKWIDRDELIAYGRKVDRSVMDGGNDAEFPGPLRKSDALLEWACSQQAELEEVFSDASIATTSVELAGICEDYTGAQDTETLAMVAQDTETRAIHDSIERSGYSVSKRSGSS